MALIDKDKFAAECLKQATKFRTYEHYMLAVAQLRSKMNDANNGSLHGVFQLTQEKWNNQRVDPELALQASDIDNTEKQCALFARWSHKVNIALADANGEDPTVEDIYHAQFPGETVDGLEQALADTLALLPKPAANVDSAAVKLAPKPTA